MGEQQKSILVLVVIATFVTTALFLPVVIRAGELEPDAAPGPTMYTLDDIYQKVTEDCPPSIIEGGIPKTGQTISYGNLDDGDLKKGVIWPIPRFTDNGDGTVTDNLTGLIWLQNANCFGRISWDSALSVSNTLKHGECGLTDNSNPGDWRLPNILELLSLYHYGVAWPFLPNTSGTGVWLEGDPFTQVQARSYWTSTNDFRPEAYKRVVWFDSPSMGGTYFNDSCCVWPVRDGQW